MVYLTPIFGLSLQNSLRPIRWTRHLSKTRRFSIAKTKPCPLIILVRNFVSIFTKWRAVQTCAVNRPGGPETRTTELERRRLIISTTLKRRPLCLLHPFHGMHFGIQKRERYIHWQHYSGGKGEHLKRLSWGKKTLLTKWRCSSLLPWQLSIK